jgi:hypothetical protein
MFEFCLAISALAALTRELEGRCAQLRARAAASERQLASEREARISAHEQASRHTARHWVAGTQRTRHAIRLRNLVATYATAPGFHSIWLGNSAHTPAIVMRECDSVLAPPAH